MLHIPRLGADWEWVVLEGTDEDDLRDGPGHFSETAMPGRVGNFAIAGHRATHGEPFADLDTLAEGDQVVVETGTEWLVYEVTWSRIMTPTSLEVLAPVAGHPGLKARQRTMTLVTCHPRWGSTERLIVGTQLVTRRTADAGPPALDRLRAQEDSCTPHSGACCQATWLKVVEAVALALGVAFVLLTWVFPAVEPLLPFDEIVVG